jgi:hypothetical protein
MENIPDSSIWRSLAVAFGDGLAFGVGMKLTQNAARRPGTPQSDLTTLADRFERLEQRLERLDHAPIAAPEALSEPGSASFTQRVIEAVVQALGERLAEHSKQTERRLAELEARIAVELKALQQQDQSLASRAQARLEEVRSQLGAQIVAVRNRVEEDMQGFTGSVAKLVEEQVASRAGALLQPVEKQLREEIRRVADRSSSFDASAADAAMEMKLEPLRVESNARNREIAEVRKRMADSDRTVLDLVLAIGQICRQAAERIAGPAAAPPESPPPLSSSGSGLRAEPAPPALETPSAGTIMEGEPPLNRIGDPLRAVLEEPVPVCPPAEAEPGIVMDPPLEYSVPAFTQLKKVPSLWRIPVASSFLLTTGGLLLLHYL